MHRDSLKQIALFSLLLTCVLPFYAQQHFDPLSSISGAASYALAYRNGYLYSGEGNTLSIYDARPGTLPPYERINRQRFRSFIDDLVIEDNTLYVCANTDGLYAFDISSPAQPALMATWKPSQLNEAVYDVAVLDDTLFIANKTKLTVLRRSGNSYIRVMDLFTLTNAFSRIRGCAIKDGLLAFTVATMSVFASPLDGIYLFDAESLSQLSFWPEPYGDAEEVHFGQENSLLHVMGGGQFTSSLPFPFSDPRGHYYVLDISVPTMPKDVFHDTIAGITGLGDTQLFDAALRNDTIYIATRTGDDQIFPVDGNVFVYDARKADSISLITDISVGLLHFDVALQGELMHVASEWFGIRTIDIQDILIPIDLGDTRTGGWCTETDIHGDLMVQANEGYGTQLFSIADRRNPVLIGYHDNVGQGFNFNARFSADGDYIYATYLEGATLNEFRVLETATMQEVGALNFFTGYEHCFVYEDRFISYAKRIIGQSYITLVNVSNPLVPQLITTKTMNVEDMQVTSSGLLWVCRTDSLLIYDISDVIGFKDAIAAAGDPFRRIANHGDTVVAYRDSGLVTYYYDTGSENIEQLNTLGPLSNGIPTHLAMDGKAIYTGYTEYGLFAVDRNSGAELDSYRTGLDFIFPQWWPLENVQVFDDLIVLTEYFGQTTLLTFEDTTTDVFDMHPSPDMRFEILPNPADESVRIVNPHGGSFTLRVLDVRGIQTFAQDFREEDNTLCIDWLPGVYFVHVLQNEKSVYCQKLVVIE